MNLNEDPIPTFLMRALGAFIGVLASLIMVAPKGTRNLLYRTIVGVIMGVIFSPVMDDIFGLGFLSGPELDHVLARAAACGFSIWFILEFIARALSSQEWMERLAREFLRLKEEQEGEADK